MTIALILLGYALLLATVGSRLLARAAWTARAPRLGVAAWQGLTAGVVSAGVLGGLALAVPTARVSIDLAALLHACTMALRAQYGSPGSAALAATGAFLALAVIGRVVWMLVAAARDAIRERRDHRQAVDVLGRADDLLGVTIVDTDAPAAYCLPGRNRRVVVTTGALATLDDDQLAAVLAHERAHLAGHHDLALTYATALRRAFPRLRVFRTAAEHTARLIEMCADDAATKATGRLTVAGALLALGAHPTPAPALGAAGAATTPARIRRLIADPPPLHARHRLAGVTGVAAVLLLPLIIAAAPAATASGMDYCPLPTPPNCTMAHCPYGS